MKSVDRSLAFAATREWLRCPLGQALLDEEARHVEDALNGLFGEDCLQLGIWGEPRAFLRFARTRHTACIASPPNVAPGESPNVYGRIHRLPIASDSVDVVILPHTLDFSGRQPEILREVHRVLRSDGHLIVLGFAPGGLWGLRRLIPGAGMPPNTANLVAENQLADWLKLLDLSIHQRSRYFFKWPLSSRQTKLTPAWETRGRRWWPELSACYMLTAQKRLYTMTPIRQPWRRPKVVGGLVEPSTRISSRISRIHVDPER